MSDPGGTAATIAAGSRIIQTAPSDVGVDVFVFSKNTQAEPVAHRIRIGSTVGEEILSAARAYLSKVTERTLLPYGPAMAVSAGHSLHIDQSRAANLVSTEASMVTGQVEQFDPRANYAKRIDLMAVRLSLADGTALTLYRVLKPMFRFERGRFIPLVQQNGQYERLEPQDLLLIDLDFDVLVAAGTAIFDKKSTFERAFGFLEELKANSKAVFATVTKDLRIEGLADLERACTSAIPMMNKMASIARSITEDQAYASAMTMSNLVNFIRANPGCEVEVRGSGHAAMLVYDNTSQKRFKILNLLDDDFLRSDLTKRDYEASSKTRT
jgi:hypothetical protein